MNEKVKKYYNFIKKLMKYNFIGTEIHPLYAPSIHPCIPSQFIFSIPPFHPSLLKLFKPNSEWRSFIIPIPSILPFMTPTKHKVSVTVTSILLSL